MDSHLEELLGRILGTDPQGVLKDEHREKLVHATLAVAPSETYEAVWKFANSISDEAKRSFLLHRLSALMADRLQFDFSERIARTIPLIYWQFDALVKVAQGLLKREGEFRHIASHQPQHPRDAFRLILEVEQNLSRVPDDDRPSLVWSAGLALAGFGELDWAERLATSPEYCPDNTEVLFRVAHAHGKNGNAVRALQIARTIAGLATRCDTQLTHRAFDLEEVGELVFEYGDEAEALRYFDEASRLACASQKAGDIDAPKCLVGIAISLAKHGRIDRAREVANTIAADYHRDRALNQIQDFAIGAA